MRSAAPRRAIGMLNRTPRPRAAHPSHTGAQRPHHSPCLHTLSMLLDSSLSSSPSTTHAPRPPAAAAAPPPAAPSGDQSAEEEVGDTEVRRPSGPAAWPPSLAGVRCREPGVSGAGGCVSCRRSTSAASTCGSHATRRERAVLLLRGLGCGSTSGAKPQRAQPPQRARPSSKAEQEPCPGRSQRDEGAVRVRRRRTCSSVDLPSWERVSASLGRFLSLRAQGAHTRRGAAGWCAAPRALSHCRLLRRHEPRQRLA